MATERKAPDVLLLQTNLSGAVTAIDEDPDSPGSDWLTYIANNVDTVCRVSFPTPSGNPNEGADLQEFKIWVRKQNGTGTPTVAVSLYENGSLVTELLSATSVTNSSGQLFSITWNANLLGTADGSLVELYIYGTAIGGAPATRATVEIGAVEWNVDYASGQTQTLNSTSNIVTSVTNALSRGITGILASTANIITSILGVLTKDVDVVIGNAAINRPSAAIAGRTWIDKKTPANGAGTLTSVEIYANAELSNCEIAIFEEISTDHYTTRSNVTLGTVPAGHSQHNVSLAVEEGDFIGIYYSAGTMDIDTDGGIDTYAYKVGDYIPCTDVAFTEDNNTVISVYGEEGTAAIALISMTILATSVTGALSRGITETLTSTSNLATSIVSILSKGLNWALTSTSNIVSSVTGILSRGVTETLNSTVNIGTFFTAILTRAVKALLSTSNIVISITNSLSRGITETLASTSNVVTSIASLLSRGITGILTSTSNIATLFTAALTKGGETLALLSTAVMSTSIVSLLSRGITQTLVSTSDIVTSIANILSRGVTETFNSTSTLTTSILGVLSRGITETLISTANIVTSVIAELTKVGSTALTSIVNIVCVMGEETDVGSLAIDRNSTYSSGFTYVDRNNPANAIGKITTIEIYANAAMSGVEVAIFYVVSGNNLSTRDTVAIGSIPIGYSSHSVNLDVEVGDFIGIYWSAGYLEMTPTTTCTGIWRIIDDYIPCTDTTFITYADKILSLYGTGSGVTLGRGITETLISTSDIVISITSALKRKYYLISTSNVATSIASILSRGITQALVSTSNVMTSFTAILRKLAKELNSVANMTISTTASLSRGIVETLVSTINMATSFTSAINRGITAALVSTVDIVTSILADLTSDLIWTEEIKSTIAYAEEEKNTVNYIEEEKNIIVWIEETK